MVPHKIATPKSFIVLMCCIVVLPDAGCAIFPHYQPNDGGALLLHAAV
jgi:hypothetical protein